MKARIGALKTWRKTQECPEAERVAEMRGYPPQGAMEKVEQRYASSTAWERQVTDNADKALVWLGVESGQNVSGL